MVAVGGNGWEAIALFWVRGDIDLQSGYHACDKVSLLTVCESLPVDKYFSNGCDVRAFCEQTAR